MALLTLGSAGTISLLQAVVPKPGWVQELLSKLVVSDAGGFKIQMLRSHLRDSYSVPLWWELNIYTFKNLLHTAMTRTSAAEDRTKSSHV